MAARPKSKEIQIVVAITPDRTVMMENLRP